MEKWTPEHSMCFMQHQTASGCSALFLISLTESETDWVATSQRSSSLCRFVLFLSHKSVEITPKNIECRPNCYLKHQHWCVPRKSWWIPNIVQLYFYDHYHSDLKAKGRTSMLLWMFVQRVWSGSFSPHSSSPIFKKHKYLEFSPWLWRERKQNRGHESLKTNWHANKAKDRGGVSEKLKLKEGI